MDAPTTPRPLRPVPPPAAAMHPAGVPMRAPTHPGRFLDRLFLRPMAITQTAAAAKLGVSRRRVNEIVTGHRGITADTAVRCAMTFGLPAAYWLGLQANWDCYQAWRALRREGLRPATTGPAREVSAPADERTPRGLGTAGVQPAAVAAATAAETPAAAAPSVSVPPPRPLG